MQSAETVLGVLLTGERRAVKVACAVRAGGRRRRTRTAGTSPTAHQDPTLRPVLSRR
jgi:hypothetical protein